MAVRTVNAATLTLIKTYEGLEDGDPTTPTLDAYLDPVDIWTIGWGHAVTDGGQFLKGAANEARARALYPGGLTTDQAELLLQADLLGTCKDVQAAVTATVNDNQFGALVSFAFNLGISNLRSSTLLAKLNAGDVVGAAAQFPRWVYANGKVLPGLERRRAAEAALFNTAV